MFRQCCITYFERIKCIRSHSCVERPTSPWETAHCICLDSLQNRWERWFILFADMGEKQGNEHHTCTPHMYRRVHSSHASRYFGWLAQWEVGDFELLWSYPRVGCASRTIRTRGRCATQVTTQMPLDSNPKPSFSHDFLSWGDIFSVFFTHIFVYWSKYENSMSKNFDVNI